MKVLILDDERIRHDAYDVQYAGSEVWHAYNAAQFRRHIESVDRFDVVSFDHDLGEGCPNGNKCANWMITHLPVDRLPELCRVHSWNPVGAENIMATLRSGGVPVERTPFACATLPERRQPIVSDEVVVCVEAAGIAWRKVP